MKYIMCYCNIVLTFPVNNVLNFHSLSSVHSWSPWLSQPPPPTTFCNKPPVRRWKKTYHIPTTSLLPKSPTLYIPLPLPSCLGRRLWEGRGSHRRRSQWDHLVKTKLPPSLPFYSRQRRQQTERGLIQGQISSMLQQDQSLAMVQFGNFVGRLGSHIDERLVGDYYRDVLNLTLNTIDRSRNLPPFVPVQATLFLLF